MKAFRVHELQLQDYTQGYKFRMTCRKCGYHWIEHPKDILDRPDMHQTMYLEEVARALQCRRCRTNNVAIMPILLRSHHSFVGGLT